jgi:radical SAM protein with 4Fe4S-binding SPASM domain
MIPAPHLATPQFIHTRPLRVYWEVTRACDLACRHCRATANPYADPAELTRAEGKRLLEELASFGEPAPHVIFTGGDPLKRRDLFELIDAAHELGLHVSVAPSATPLLTDEALLALAGAGVDAISLSLDGSTAERHDAIRGITGTYQRTLEAARVARVVHLPFQVNTLVCADTVDDLAAIHEQVVQLAAARWSLFFLVTVGRGQLLQAISAERAEQVLEWVAGLSRRPPAPIITTTEAPQLRRIAMQRPGGGAHHAAGVRDGNGIIFISHTGDICPSGFLEVAAGNVRTANIVDVYREAPLFLQLRDADGFHGRCGRCEYRWMCGGSRARAYCASGGDPLAEDPLCTYAPTKKRFGTSIVIVRIA